MLPPWLLWQLLWLLLCLPSLGRGFVNSPKIISKDGNLIFESGTNRNISIRLTGKSRLFINEEYDVLELLMVCGNSSLDKKPMRGPDETNDVREQVEQLLDQLDDLKRRVLGISGIRIQLRQLQNRTQSTRVMLRHYQITLRLVESKVQRLNTQLELDSCQSAPCKNGGSCFNAFNGFRCQCRSSFEGSKCELDVNECPLYEGTDLGCQNGAQCVNQFGSFSCICPPGWYGTHCTQRKGDCTQASPWELCAHGACVASSDAFGYSCLCDQGWRSNGVTPACSVDVDECAAESHTPCATKCINLPGSFACAPCSPGLTGNGVTCRDVNECEIHNGGCSQNPLVVCINSYGSFHCGECPLGWKGDGRSCERNAASDAVSLNSFTSCTQRAFICHPAALCSDISSTVVCSCPAGMLGSGFGPQGCVTGSANNCNDFPCLNGGTCMDQGTANYTCFCPPGYHPPRCDSPTDHCQPNPCLNGARCRMTNDYTDFVCQCEPGYRGRRCDARFSSCNALLTGFSGRLRYPPDGGNYSHSTQCAWVIRTNDSLVLNVTFAAFDLEDVSECRFDWLQINDGRSAAAQVIGRYCGHRKPHGGNIVSSTNYLYLWFRSDNSTAHEGFDLTWESIPPQCGGLLDFETQGTIATPGSPGNYPRNRDCQWTLRAQSTKRIKLTFFSLQLEQHSSCNFDYVVISDAVSGHEFVRYCQSSHPTPLLLSTHKAIVHFHSDGQDSDTGFQLHYSAEERLPGCGGTYTAPEGRVRSPLVDSGEPISCEYLIQMGVGETVSLEFMRLELRGIVDCLELYDVSDDGETLQRKYCGYEDRSTELPPHYNSQYNRVKLSYYSKLGSSFEMRYRKLCSYTYEANSGVVFTPGYPSLALTERSCTYKIVTEPSTVIELHRVDFQLLDPLLMDDGDCDGSSLIFNDGLNRNMSGPYCNNQLPPEDYVTVSNMLILQFSTSNAAHGRGFKFQYKAVPAGTAACGGVYTKSGQVIRYERDGYTGRSSCYWVIMAPPRRAIQLSWLSFALWEPASCMFDYVEIYDNLANSDGDKPLVHYCGETTPSDFVSHARLLTIKFVSEFSEATGGFALSYRFVEQQNCGGHIYASTGQLTSPEFPLQYRDGLDCYWQLTGPIGSQLELQLELFELQATPDCTGDWLTVYNGASNTSNLIGRFCGSTIPKRIPSFSNELSLQFHSDAFISARGFRLSWRIYAHGCGGRLQATEGVITSPQYPLPYPHNAKCEWLVTVPPGSSVRFVIEDIDMESSYSCFYDSLQIHDGRYTDYTDAVPLHRSCAAPPSVNVVQTMHNQATVVFSSDSSNNARGFRLSYTTNCWREIADAQGVIESLNLVQPMQRYMNCSWLIRAPRGSRIQLEFSDFKSALRVEPLLQAGVYIVEPNAMNQLITGVGSHISQSNMLQIVHNSTVVSFRLEFRIDGCMHDFRSAQGSFQSPNYPAMYPNNIECHWVMHTQPDTAIELTIEHMDIEESPFCQNDALLIGERGLEFSPHDRHCGRMPKLVYTSGANHLDVFFNSSEQHNGRGFNASYRTVHTACGGRMSSSSGTLKSPNYPSFYPRNSHCEWTIEVAEHHTIVFELQDVELESSSHCSWDYVEAYELTELDTGESKQIFQVCSMPISATPLQSKSNLAIVRFVSDDSMEHKGFKLNYYQSCGQRLLVDEADVGYIQLVRHVAANDSCQWEIMATDPGRHIMFTPTHVLLNRQLAARYTKESDCLERGVKIYEGMKALGTPRLKYCLSHPPAIISYGNALTITVPLELISEFEGHFMTMDTLCGSQYNALSGKFTSPYYPDPYPVNIECVWLVEASAGNSITLVFESIDMESSDDCNNDYVEVREQNERGHLLGVFCGQSVPPPIKGSKAIWIKFKSNDDVVGEGFMASYNYELHNELSGSSGIVESPRYPSKVQVVQPYSWRITVDKDYVVLLTVKHITDIDTPHIRFYDGYTDIGIELEYDRNHRIMSSTNIVYFTAQRGPFQLEWERLSKDELRSDQRAQQQSKLCGEPFVLVNRTMSFSSPGFPHGYASNLQCSWSFLPADPATHAVVTIGKVDLEQMSECFADYLSISVSIDLEEWQQLLKTCMEPNDTMVAYHGRPYLKVEFVSDASENRTGVSMTVRTQCGSELTAQRGTVNITRLLTTFGVQDCVWTLRVRQGRRLRIIFVDSSIRDPNASIGSCYNYFLIRDGFAEDSPFLGRGKYCDNNITDILETSSNRAYVKFHRVGQVRFGAAFHYEEISHACSEDIMLTEDDVGSFGNSRLLTPPNYPNPPNPHSECVWRISAPVHHIISMMFSQWNGNGVTPATGADPDPDCEHEYLQVNDGSTELSPLLGRYCRNQQPDSIFSRGSTLRVKYFSEVSEPRLNFRAFIVLGRCGGTYYSREAIINVPEDLQLTQIGNTFECAYTIQVDKGNMIKLSFERVNLPETNNCTLHTHIQLDEMEPFGQPGEERVSDTLVLCGQTSREYTVETNKVVVRLQMPAGALVKGEGFRLRYQAIGSRCFETIEASSGVLQSPGYPDGVQLGTHCLWKLKVTKGKRVKVEVLDFDTGAKNDSGSRVLGGRILFSNDFQLTSVIGRYSEAPPAEVVSTDNTMGIDAFLIPFNRHRGFKLRFSEFGESVCHGAQNLDQDRLLVFHRQHNNQPLHCSYELKVPRDNTLVLRVTQHVSNSLSANPHVCRVVSPLKLQLKDEQLLPQQLCAADSNVTVRLPFGVQMLVTGNERNQLQTLSVLLKSFHCGGIRPLDLGDNMTITQPQMPADFGNGTLDCAWAIWPPDISEENFDELNYWMDGIQIEVSLIVDFAGDCKDHYLLLYNGPDQNSPYLGRYCSQASFSNLVVERGLFFEYHTEQYERNSTFNLTVHHGSGCGGQISYPYRQIVFDEQYKNNVECVWEIDTTAGFHVGLYFLGRFYIESSANCSKDYLKVQQHDEASGEWKDLQVICGREPPRFVNTSTAAMRLIFHSDGNIVGDGFTVRFERNCGGLLYADGTTQLLQSPGYPHGYARNLHCNYTIVPRDAHASGVQVQFIDFDMEHAPMNICMYDNVTIETTDAMGQITETQLCGVKRKHQYLGKRSVSVTLRSDSSFSGKGFKLSYSTHLCGGLINETSMIESPRQHTDNNLPPNSDCYWNLTAPTGYKMTIKFEFIDFENQWQCFFDGVEVFRGALPNESQRMGRFCGNITGQLPILNIATTQALIHSFSDHRDASRGFKALVRMMPNCDERIHLSEHNSNYTFDKFSRGYAHNLDCSYLFVTTPGQQLQVEFHSFHVEQTHECHDDFLVIRDGAGPFADMIGLFCGQDLPPKLSSSRQALYMRFVSDRMFQDEGFVATVMSVPLLCGQPLLRLEEKSAVQLSSASDSSGLYPNNIFCYWKIVGDHELHIEFNKLELEEPSETGNCEADYLRIYSREDDDLAETGYSPQLIFSNRQREYETSPGDHIYCGHELPDDYYVNSKEAFVKFRSNEVINKAGFSLTVTQVSGCFRNFTGLQGRIKLKESADYCDVYISAPINYTLSVYYSNLETGSHDCASGFVEVFDAHTNRSLQKICAYFDNNQMLFTSTNALRLRFKMSGYLTQYDITYLASDQGVGCGGSLYNTMGIFSNAYYPLNVRNNSDCRWNVRVPSNSIVKLLFGFFNLGSKSTCHTDYLEVLERNELGVEVQMQRFCGGDTPEFYKSTHNQLVVRFHKTVNYDGIGWVIKFVAVREHDAINDRLRRVN